MMRLLKVAGFAAAASWLLGPGAWASPKPDLVTCNSFMRDYQQSLGDYRVNFEHPLTITRDFAGDEPGLSIYVLSTNVGVDGTLKCRGDEFRRFEVRIGAPADAKTAAIFTRFEEASLASLFRWEPARSATVVSAMSSDADEYLRASIQRGDTYHAGKVEYHQGGRYDLGLIWTETDHTFILTSQDDT